MKYINFFKNMKMNITHKIKILIQKVNHQKSAN